MTPSFRPTWMLHLSTALTLYIQVIYFDTKLTTFWLQKKYINRNLMFLNAPGDKNANDSVNGLFLAYQLLRQYTTSTLSCDNIKYIHITIATGIIKPVALSMKINTPRSIKMFLNTTNYWHSKAFVMLLSFIVHTLVLIFFKSSTVHMNCISSSVEPQKGVIKLIYFHTAAV